MNPPPKHPSSPFTIESQAAKEGMTLRVMVVLALSMSAPASCDGVADLPSAPYSTAIAGYNYTHTDRDQHLLLAHTRAHPCQFWQYECVWRPCPIATLHVCKRVLFCTL
jgi:hypothetical protein